MLDISDRNHRSTPRDKSRRRFATSLLGWYDQSRRDLPWRVLADRSNYPDPYAVLVSEFMLQQTQVATVVPYFQRFMARFPTVEDLAAAPEQQVLRLWQGLGYYARARNLHAAAKKVAADFGSQVPRTLVDLLTLPGVGRYTAGAIASIAFGVKAPIVDGNIVRVLCRLDKIQTDPRAKETVERLWLRAEQLLPDKRIGDFNSALMELGATLCTTKSPCCLVCPVRSFCRAAEAGVQDSIPAPKRAAPTPIHRRWTFCLSRQKRWLIERRPSTGRWAGLWQFVTLEATAPRPGAKVLKENLALRRSRPRLIGRIRHALTHRRYVFDVFVANADGVVPAAPGRTRRWVSLRQIDKFPLSRPQLKIAQMLQTIEIKP